MRVSHLFAAFAVCGAVIYLPSTAFAQGAGLVISQVYGGGGMTGATYNRDFVELFNRSSATISLTNYTLQCAAGNGNFTQLMSLSGSIPSGGFYLVGMNFGIAGKDIPAPDTMGNLDLAYPNGKVALANSSITVAFNNTNNPDTFSPNVVDFVGYGTANAYEGAGAAPATSTTTSTVRRFTGNPSSNFVDSNNNNTDFAASGAGELNFAARNSSSANPFGANFAPIVIPEANTVGLLALALPLVGVTIARRRK